jgi:hypothetical protein
MLTPRITEPLANQADRPRAGTGFSRENQSGQN